MLRKSLPSILFLALFVPPLAALEERLVGTWEASGGGEGSLVALLVFQEDGTFELSAVRTEEFARPHFARPHGVFREDAEVSTVDVKTLVQLAREALPEAPLDASSILGSGTYEASG